MPAIKNTIQSKVSHELLLKRLNYNKDTGIFQWKEVNPKANSAKHGEAIGRVNKEGYVVITLEGAKIVAHRLAWFYVTGRLPDGEVDHVNHDKRDNSWENLREVTRLNNSRNKSKHKNNSSGITGVYWVGRIRKWQASIGVYLESETRSIRKHLGYFKCIEEATAARRAAEIKYNYHPNHGK